MGWIQLLLLGFLSSCFTCSSGVWGYRIERSPDERFRQLCEGAEVELKNCNLRLAKKIEYTTGIEKEVFTLKRQLRQLRLTCKDASQAASVQISALQNQLDSLLKQLGESTSGPANEVMIIMQKYINMKKLEMDMSMQSDTSKISLMQDQLKALEAELKQKTAALKEVKCSADGGGEEAEISRIVEEINKLSLEGSTSAEISRLAGLKTILDKKLNKMDGTGFATSEKISVIMEGNEQMVVIQRKLADLLKTEAEYTALLQRLKVKKVLLSDLKEEKNEKGPNPELSKHITVVEKEVWALEDELELLKRTLSRREVLEKELLQKKKQVEGKLEELKKKMELFSRLLSVQLELQVTQVRWMGEKAAAEVLIKDLQKHLEEKEDKISRLLAKNIYLDKKLADLMAECDDIQVKFNELSDQLEATLGKLPNTNLKYVLEIVTLNIDIDSIRETITREKSLSKIEELKKLLKKKTDELNLKKYELKNKDPSAVKILVIIEKTKEIQNLQSSVVNVNDLDSISKLQKELIKLIDDLDDSNPAKLVLKNMVMLSEESWLKKLINKMNQRSQQQITDLEKVLKETEETLKYKTAELVKTGSYADQLIKDIVVLRGDVKKIKEELSRLQVSSVSQVAELEKMLTKTKQELEKGNRSLNDKDAELAKNMARITQLIEELRQTKLRAQENDEEAAATIADLEKRVRKSEEEKNRVKQENRKLQEDLREARKCTEVHESYSELQDKYDKEVSKLSNNFARQVLTIKTLSDEVSLLKSKLSVATGNTDALEAELKKKSGDLMKVMKELEKSKVDSSEMVKLLEAMRKLNKQQDQSIAEYLAEIDALGKEMEGLTAKLGTRGDEKAQLTIQVMVLKEEISKLEKLQSDLKQEAVKKSESLKNEIEETKKEIIFLKRSGCKTEETKQQIDRLQVEVKAKERELEKLKQNSEAEQDQLAEKLAQIAKKLESSGVELKKKDAQNAELIQQLLDLGQKLKDSQSGQNTIKEEAEKQINDLKIKLKNKEVELSQLKISNSDLEERVRKSEEEKNRVKQENRKLQEDLKEARKCTEVHESYSELQTKFDKDVSKLTNDFARQVLTIQTLSDEVTALQNKLSKSEGNTDALQVELKKKTADLEKVTKELSKSKLGSAETVKLLEAMRKLNKQQDQSIAEYLAEIDALGKDMEGLMAKLGSRGDEKAQLTIQVMVLKEEISKLEKLQSDLKQEAVKKTESLKNEIEETKKEIIFLKKSGCKTEETKQQIDRLQVEVKAKERELEKLKKNTEAELDQLMEKLSEKTKKLEFSGKELSEKDEQNAKLIQQLIDLGQKMKETQSGQKTIKEEAEKQINDLKQQLQKKEEDVSKLKQSNTDLKEQVKNKDKDVSQLNNEKAALNAELGKKKEELIKAEKEVKVKEEAIDNVKKELKTKEEEIKGGCSEVKKKLKSKEEEVTKLKESHKNTLNENEKLKTQISDTDAKLQELEELERENEELQKELAKVQEEYKNKIEETKTNAFTVVSPEWDPDTAHPQLLLTSKGKAVKASEFARFVPDNPERFNAALAALGKKGYDSGKPYWEVDVDIRACFVVGVAKKSANRKGSLAYGPKNGYWVIVRRKDGQYHALNDKTTPLKLPVKPTVIGVLLDFNKGNVVFFNAKTKKPIYTYHNNKFSETLFPYIETCHSQGKNEPPIVVSDADSVLMDNVS
ncbi:myosin-2 heavy chain-like [Astyanax mexicanus]|uniref:Myosin-2 heavy chain-like n=1 Tax=Astyanax mexicanus TaxID=7994 RepID=A0A8T2KYF0_ASTMX|nr:myosin-2 heavy chain-like [Astyanax mexicanus]